jgi:3-dehydroquinate synthase
MALPKNTQSIQVKAGSSSYPVICGAGSLSPLSELLITHAGVGPLFVLSSPRVWNFCGPKIRHALKGANVSRVILFDDHESAKTPRAVEMLCRKLIRAGARRNATIVAAGGGVVGDIAGFVAATFLRGVSLVHVPTTLLAQVDSAIGGKTGVNLPEGKNLVGAFHQPKLVVCDPTLLNSLPERQFRAGLFEVVKYAAIADQRLFELMEAKLTGISRHDMRALMEIILRCVKIKAAIVGRDEREDGGRAVLNFGHTLGHALETVTNYRHFLHGEAVGWGMLAASLVSVALGKLDPDVAARMIRMIAGVERLPALSKTSATRILDVMQRDKKSREGIVRWVLPIGIGRAEYGAAVPQESFRRVWAALPEWERKAREAECLGAEYRA